MDDEFTRRLVTRGIVFNVSDDAVVETYENHGASAIFANPQGFRYLARLMTEFAELSEHSIDFMNLSPSVQLEPGSVEVRIGTHATSDERARALAVLPVMDAAAFDRMIRGSRGGGSSGAQ